MNTTPRNTLCTALEAAESGMRVHLRSVQRNLTKAHQHPHGGST